VKDTTEAKVSEELVEAIADRVVRKLGEADNMFDIYGAAKYIGCSVATIERRIRSGELPSVKVGRLRRLRKGDLDRLGVER
jgi:excisionase family DNA binding protein